MTLHRPAVSPVAQPHEHGDEAPIICFSHLRRNFVQQRPQHLMTRFARTRPVWSWEEPIPTDHHLPYLECHAFTGTQVQAIRPRLPRDLHPDARTATLAALFTQFLAITGISLPVLWLCTPQMWPMARHIRNAAVVYDCMDELSAFDHADPALPALERGLMAADVVFTGGHSLYATKRHLHGNIHAFPSSVERSHFARAATLHLRDQGDGVPFWCPINEISFMAWAAGEAGYMHPFAQGRGFEMKVQLARAAIAAISALRDVDPRARIMLAEPLIAVHPDTTAPAAMAEAREAAQFETCDLIAGRLWPQIGGAESFLVLIGVSYYVNNQWCHGGAVLDVDDPRYRPLSDLLAMVAARYDRPLVISETGIEDRRRAAWLRMVGTEIARARARGIRVEGLCLCPVADHPDGTTTAFVRTGCWAWPTARGGGRSTPGLRRF